MLRLDVKSNRVMKLKGKDLHVLSVLPSNGRDHRIESSSGRKQELPCSAVLYIRQVTFRRDVSADLMTESSVQIPTFIG